MSDSKGLGRFFKGDESGDIGSASARDFADAEKTIGALQSRIAELEGAAGRPSFIDMDEDALTQIAAEDAAVIIRAARMRAGKLIEQATETLQQAESEREQIRASCELDARQTREAANVDARKLRAEATATLETARDQASQLLEATQNDADSQAAENQKVIAKLLDDATKRASEVAVEAEKETDALRATTENEISKLNASATKASNDQITAAQNEAKRLQTEATNAVQSMLEKATGDARALGEDASKNHNATISDAQAKLQQAEKQAEQIISQAQAKADEIGRATAAKSKAAAAKSKADAAALRDAAIVYRDNVLASLDVNRAIFDDIKKRIADLRTLWFDQAHLHLKDSEEAVSDLMTRMADSRATIYGTVTEFPAESITGENSDDN